MIGLLRESMYPNVLVVVQWTGRGRDRTVKDCLRKSRLDVRHARRMVQDRSEWRGFVRRNAWGIARGMNLDEMP